MDSRAVSEKPSFIVFISRSELVSWSKARERPELNVSFASWTLFQKFTAASQALSICEAVWASGRRTVYSAQALPLYPSVT